MTTEVAFAVCFGAGSIAALVVAFVGEHWPTTWRIGRPQSDEYDITPSWKRVRR